MTPEVELYDAAADEVIAAELVRCTLGQARRVELRTDILGAMVRMTVTIRDELTPALKRAMAALVPLVKRFDEVMERAGEQLADEAETFLEQDGPQ